jgi:hypothetical protein
MIAFTSLENPHEALNIRVVGTLIMPYNYHPLVCTIYEISLILFTVFDIVTRNFMQKLIVAPKH